MFKSFAENVGIEAHGERAYSPTFCVLHEPGISCNRASRALTSASDIGRFTETMASLASVQSR